MVSNAGCAADYWINPTVPDKVADTDDNGTLIEHMPYPVNGMVYQAIRFQTEGANGTLVWVYDLETGLLIHNSSSTRGAPVLTPPVGGQEGRAGVSTGGTMLAPGHLMQVKDVPMPWRKMPAPSWTTQFRRLRYDGVQTTDMPSVAYSRLQRPMTLVLVPDARGHGWLRFTTRTVIQSIMGMPLEQHAAQGACGDGSVGGLWIPPQALADLKQGQVLERDRIVRTVAEVTDAGGGTVTISEIGQRHRVDNTYDMGSGILAAVRVSRTIGHPGMGQGNIVETIRLATQP